jgi:four helix bundle protein
MKIERFEDLIAWQEARKLVNLIYDITQKNNFKDFGLANQIQKAAVSVMANISEGFGRYSFKDSKQFFTMARGSVLEVQSHLYVILDRKMISEGLFKNIYEQAIKTSKLINGLIRNVNTQIAK